MNIHLGSGELFVETYGGPMDGALQSLGMVSDSTLVMDDVISGSFVTSIGVVGSFDMALTPEGVDLFRGWEWLSLWYRHPEDAWWER